MQEIRPLKKRVLASLSLISVLLFAQTVSLPETLRSINLPWGETVFALPQAAAQSRSSQTESKPTVLNVGNARFEIYQTGGRLGVSAADVNNYVRDASRAVIAYYGSFPVERTVVVVEATDDYGVGFATSTHEDAGGYGLIEIQIGRHATNNELRTSWTLTHEMMHLAFPIMGKRHRWLAEGIATYVEPIGRMRIGRLTREEMWGDLAENLHKGLPSASDDGGLNQVQGYRRMYWGGALYCLLADVEIRKRTRNRMGLEEALRAVADMGGTAASDWNAEKSLRVADGAIGARVLQDLYDQMAETPRNVDVRNLLRQLGVKRTGNAIVLDDEAPLATVRRAIENGTAPRISQRLD